MTNQRLPAIVDYSNRIGETLRGNRRIGAGSGAGWDRQFS
jgi:hypothetical protein